MIIDKWGLSTDNILIPQYTPYLTEIIDSFI